MNQIFKDILSQSPLGTLMGFARWLIDKIEKNETHAL